MDKEIIIIRLPSEAEQTLGTGLFGEFEFKTLELSWRQNQRGVSCIPAGEYGCIKILATASIPYPHIAILNVQNRDGVRIHKANYWRQLRGCIAVGDAHVDIDGDGNKDVRNSGKTFEKLMSLLPETFKLKIR